MENNQQHNIILTVNEAAKFLRIGRTSLYALMKKPGFPVLRLNGRTLIPQQPLNAWLEAQMNESVI